MTDRTSAKKKCVFYGTALGDGLKYILPLSDEFAAEYLLSAFTLHRTDQIVEDAKKLRGEIDDCRLLICHHPDTIIIADPQQRAAHERLVASVPAECRVIRIPHFYCRVLWPFHCADPRNDLPSPKDRHDRHRLYESGDAYLLERLNDGMAPEAVIQHYLDLDVASVVDLDNLLQQTLADARRADKLSSIQLAALFEEAFGLSNPFVAFHLPSNFFLLCLVNEILKFLDFRPLPERILHRIQPLLRPQIPIHPSIGRYFGLPYITDQTRYLLDRRVMMVNNYSHVFDLRRRLTFGEYIRDYVYFA